MNATGHHQKALTVLFDIGLSAVCEYNKNDASV